MTAIADANLQRLFAAAINEQQLTQGIVNTSHDAFCAALNERLEVAERMAEAMTALDVELKEAWELRILPASALNTKTITQYEDALADYRQSKERR